MEEKDFSMVGRLGFAKSVAQAIPAYTMQIFLIPKGITSKIDGIVRNFLWGFKCQAKKHLHLNSWESIFKPKSNGGLKLQTFYYMKKIYERKEEFGLSSCKECIILDMGSYPKL